MIFIPIIIFLKVARGCRPADVWVKLLAAGSMRRPADIESKDTGQAFKIVSRLQTVAGCVLSADIFAVSCPQVLFPIAFGIL